MKHTRCPTCDEPFRCQANGLIHHFCLIVQVWWSTNGLWWSNALDQPEPRLPDKTSLIFIDIPNIATMPAISPN